MVIGADLAGASWQDIVEFLLLVRDRCKTVADYFQLHGQMQPDFIPMLRSLIRSLEIEDYVGLEQCDGSMRYDRRIRVVDGLTLGRQI